METPSPRAVQSRALAARPLLGASLSLTGDLCATRYFEQDALFSGVERMDLPNGRPACLGKQIASNASDPSMPSGPAVRQKSYSSCPSGRPAPPNWSWSREPKARNLSANRERVSGDDLGNPNTINVAVSEQRQSGDRVGMLPAAFDAAVSAQAQGPIEKGR